MRVRRKSHSIKKNRLPPLNNREIVHQEDINDNEKSTTK